MQTLLSLVSTESLLSIRRICFTLQVRSEQAILLNSRIPSRENKTDNNCRRYCSLPGTTKLFPPCLGEMFARVSNKLSSVLVGFHWYQGSSKTVGTVIGMLFLCVMMFALAYYCCSKDAETGFPSFQIKQFQSPVAQNNNNNNNNNNADGFGYSGVKFTSGVSIPNNNGRQKTSRQVRKDSLNALGAESKYSFKKYKRKKKPGKRKCSAVTTNGEPSSPTLL